MVLLLLWQEMTELVESSLHRWVGSPCCLHFPNPLSAHVVPHLPGCHQQRLCWFSLPAHEKAATVSAGWFMKGSRKCCKVSGRNGQWHVGRRKLKTFTLEQTHSFNRDYFISCQISSFVSYLCRVFNVKYRMFLYPILCSCWSTDKLNWSCWNNLSDHRCFLFRKRSGHCIRNLKPAVKLFQNLCLSVPVSKLKYFSQSFEVWLVPFKSGLLEAPGM